MTQQKLSDYLKQMGGVVTAPYGEPMELIAIKDRIRIVAIASRLLEALEWIIEYDDKINEHFEEYHKAKQAIADCQKLLSGDE